MTKQSAQIQLFAADGFLPNVTHILTSMLNSLKDENIQICRGKSKLV
jgi:hypothetical protein